MMEQAEYEARKQTLIEEIVAAFGRVEREEGVSFHEAEILDNHGLLDRDARLRVEARAKDNEARWQDIPFDLITDEGCGILNFLDPKGFRYYIPAFMLWYLWYEDSEENCGSNTFESVDYQLLGGSEQEIGELYLERFSILNRQQAQAIAHFIQFDVMRSAKMFTEGEADLRAELIRQQITTEEMEERLRLHKVPYLIFNSSERALERYWGQFL